MVETKFQQVAIIGLGLMGASIAAGIKQQALAANVVAWDADATSLDLGCDLGLIDKASDSIADATSEADLIILSVPVQAMAGVLSQITLNGQIITDVSSVKGFVIDTVKAVYGEIPANFVPGHPIAGSEKHGVIAANPDLFRRHRVILTPLKETSDQSAEKVTRLWTSLGAEVVLMTPEHHDDVLAQTSHLPHLLAYALVDTLSAGGDSLEVFEYAAGGFRDFSRIAASDPTMWSDIFSTNVSPVVDILEKYVTELQHLKQLIEEGDSEALKAVFERAKAARDHFSKLQQTRHANGG